MKDRKQIRDNGEEKCYLGCFIYALELEKNRLTFLDLEWKRQFETKALKFTVNYPRNQTPQLRSDTIQKYRYAESGE